MKIYFKTVTVPSCVSKMKKINKINVKDPYYFEDEDGEIEQEHNIMKVNDRLSLDSNDIDKLPILMPVLQRNDKASSKNVIYKPPQPKPGRSLKDELLSLNNDSDIIAFISKHTIHDVSQDNLPSYVNVIIEENIPSIERYSMLISLGLYGLASQMIPFFIENTEHTHLLSYLMILAVKSNRFLLAKLLAEGLLTGDYKFLGKTALHFLHFPNITLIDVVNDLAASSLTIEKRAVSSQTTFISNYYNYFRKNSTFEELFDICNDNGLDVLTNDIFEHMKNGIIKHSHNESISSFERRTSKQLYAILKRSLLHTKFNYYFIELFCAGEITSNQRLMKYILDNKKLTSIANKLMSGYINKCTNLDIKRLNKFRMQRTGLTYIA